MFSAVYFLALLVCVSCESIPTREEIKDRLGFPFQPIKEDVEYLMGVVEELQITLNLIMECGLPKMIKKADMTLDVGDASALYTCCEGCIHQTSMTSYCHDGQWSDIDLVCTDLKDCFINVDGRGVYAGTQAVTGNGRTCQEWATQYPHGHSQTEDRFSATSGYGPESYQEAANYCRDPDKEGFPWCYTTDESVRWESCGISPCS